MLQGENYATRWHWVRLRTMLQNANMMRRFKDEPLHRPTDPLQRRFFRQYPAVYVCHARCHRYVRELLCVPIHSGVAQFGPRDFASHETSYGSGQSIDITWFGETSMISI